MDMGTALASIKDWSGRFYTESDLRMPMSTQDKAQSLLEVGQVFQNLFYNIPFASVEELDLDISGFLELVSLRDLDHVYPRHKLIEKAQKILEARNQGQPVGEGEQPPEEAAQETPGVVEDVKRELAPATVLAQGGVT